MGCIGTRDKRNYQRILEEIDQELLFDRLNIESIKTAFFGIKNKKITFDEMSYCLSKTNIQLSKLPKAEKLKSFLDIFRMNSDFQVIFYDFMRVLIIMLLYSEDPVEGKFQLIFDLFDSDKDGKLLKNEVQEIYLYVLETIYNFYIGMLTFHNALAPQSETSDLLEAQYNYLSKNPEALESFMAYMMKGKESLDRRKFVKHIKKYSNDEQLLDFSSPKTIRYSIFQQILKEYPKADLPK